MIRETDGRRLTPTERTIRDEEHPGQYCCCICKAWKSYSNFHKDSSRPRGISYKCRVCASSMASTGHRKRKYSLTHNELSSMLIAQSGLCAICTSELNGTYHVDHHHGSGKIRGLLCVSCNLALGGFKDNPNLLRSAAAYIERFANGN